VRKNCGDRYEKYCYLKRGGQGKGANDGWNSQWIEGRIEPTKCLLFGGYDIGILIIIFGVLELQDRLRKLFPSEGKSFGVYCDGPTPKLLSLS